MSSEIQRRNEERYRNLARRAAWVRKYRVRRDEAMLAQYWAWFEVRPDEAE